MCSIAHWIYFLLFVHAFGLIKMCLLYIIYCDSLVFVYVYHSGQHLLHSSLFPWLSGCFAKTCISIYLVLWRLYLILMYFLGGLELDNIMIVELFEVYTIYKTIFLLIGVCHCAKRNFIEFMPPRTEVDHCHILGTLLA